MTPPEPSWRKPVGMLLILFMLGLWCIVVVTLVDATRLPTLVALALYVVGGIAWLWLFPMRRMLRWMELGRWRD